jgi:hypothetical protein
VKTPLAGRVTLALEKAPYCIACLSFGITKLLSVRYDWRFSGALKPIGFVLTGSTISTLRNLTLAV